LIRFDSTASFALAALQDAANPLWRMTNWVVVKLSYWLYSRVSGVIPELWSAILRMEKARKAWETDE
jgi:hypothetical protein